MNLIDFLTHYPMPPRIQRGKPKRTLSITFTEEEADVISRLANHPDTKDIYDRNMYQVVRHALHHFVWSLEDLLDTDPKFVSVVTQLKGLLKSHNLNVGHEELHVALNQLSDQVNMLVDFGEVDGALIEYDQFLDRVATLPLWWSSVVHRMIGDHLEMERFRSRVEKLGFNRAMDLKEIEEKERD